MGYHHGIRGNALNTPIIVVVSAALSLEEGGLSAVPSDGVGNVAGVVPRGFARLTWAFPRGGAITVSGTEVPGEPGVGLAPAELLLKVDPVPQRRHLEVVQEFLGLGGGRGVVGVVA